MVVKKNGQCAGETHYQVADRPSHIRPEIMPASVVLEDRATALLVHDCWKFRGVFYLYDGGQRCGERKPVRFPWSCWLTTEMKKLAWQLQYRLPCIESQLSYRSSIDSWSAWRHRMTLSEADQSFAGIRSVLCSMYRQSRWRNPVNKDDKKQWVDLTRTVSIGYPLRLKNYMVTKKKYIYTIGIIRADEKEKQQQYHPYMLYIYGRTKKRKL